MKYKLKDETGKYVLQMRAKGASWQAIGDALGITRQSAWERFRHLPGCAAKGTAISKPTDLPDARKSALRMWAEGASWQAIGDALGITRQSAWERFRPLCVYRKGQGIPGSVLQARYQQPHDFAGWAIESAKTDKIIQQWLETPDSELGRMAKFGHAVPPIRLLGRDVLRNFLMAAGHDDIAPGSVPESANCPVCGRSFRNEHFLASHRKRDHGKTTAKHKPIN
jgi:biotin operon repressor